MSDDDDNLLNRRIKKAISMMRLPRTLDDDGICTRCGVPDVHCQCEDLHQATLEGDTP